MKPWICGDMNDTRAFLARVKELDEPHGFRGGVAYRGIVANVRLLGAVGPMRRALEAAMAYVDQEDDRMPYFEVSGNQLRRIISDELTKKEAP